MPDILSLKKGDYLVWRDKDLDLIQGRITDGMVGKIVMPSPNRLADKARAAGLYTRAGQSSDIGLSPRAKGVPGLG